MMEQRRPDPPIAALFILLVVALVLAVVALVRSASDSPINSFLVAMSDDEYEEAALALSDERGVDRWLARTELFTLLRGEIQGYQRSGTILLQPGAGWISAVTFHWEDGYRQCLLLRQGEDGSLGLAGGYFDCDMLAERVPEGGQQIPEQKPPDGPVVPGGPEPFGPPSTPPDAPLLPEAPDAAPER
ncbi:hypothetical protein BH23ACT11_BH23ACT11_18860 [soil metagenome]